VTPATEALTVGARLADSVVELAFEYKDNNPEVDNETCSLLF